MTPRKAQLTGAGQRGQTEGSQQCGWLGAYLSQTPPCWAEAAKASAPDGAGRGVRESGE